MVLDYICWKFMQVLQGYLSLEWPLCRFFTVYNVSEVSLFTLISPCDSLFNEPCSLADLLFKLLTNQSTHQLTMTGGYGCLLSSWTTFMFFECFPCNVNNAGSWGKAENMITFIASRHCSPRDYIIVWLLDTSFFDLCVVYVPIFLGHLYGDFF